MYCKHCGNEVKKGSKFCGKCGLKITLSKKGEKAKDPKNIDMLICKNCGVEQKPDSKFCKNCGQKISLSDKQTDNKKIEQSEIHTPIKKETATNKKSIIRYTVILVIILFFTSGYWFPFVSDYVTVGINSMSSSEDIKSIALKSGLNIHGQAIYYQSNPELVDADTLNTKCPNEDENSVEYGCYVPKENRIFILKVTDTDYKSIEYSTASHEVLHVAWRRLDELERQKVISSLKLIYNNNSDPSYSRLHELLKSYPKDDSTVYDELHSFVGSEIDTSSSELEGYYNKYFSDRQISVNADKQFTLLINNKIAELNSEYDSLGTLSASIDNYKAKWLDSIQRYMNQNRYYGDTYTYNKNVDAYNHNLISYNAQVDSYNKQRLAYNNKVDEFNALMKSFYPTRTPLQTKQ